jgi:hypothetical protein
MRKPDKGAREMPIMALRPYIGSVVLSLSVFLLPAIFLVAMTAPQQHPRLSPQALAGAHGMEPEGNNTVADGEDDDERPSAHPSPASQPFG